MIKPVLASAAMATEMTPNRAVADSQGRADTAGVYGRAWERLIAPHAVLVVVSVAYSVACLTLVPRDLGLSWDEIVYTSQFGVDLVPMPWGGHRAWGSALLVAPVAVFTKSITVLRTYLAVVAGLAMFLAFRPWLEVFDRGRLVRHTAPLAALLFGLTWLSIYYGTKGYPNLWLAFALVAGTGHFITALRRPAAVGPLVGAFLAFTVAALFRPTDTVAAAAPIALTLLVPRWRSPKAVAVALAGVAVGTAPWVIEAFLRFGGPINRLQRSTGAANAGLRLRLVDQLHAADGPYLLCSPQTCGGVTTGVAAWWVGQVLVAVIGVLIARRTRLFLPVLLVLASAAAFAGPYFTVVGNSHPRFLIPAYALLAVAVAYALLGVISRSLGRARLLTAALVAAGVLGQGTAHGETLARARDIQVGISEQTRVSVAVLREKGVTAPCLLYGRYAVGLSYETGCDRAQTDRPPVARNEVIQRALADGHRVVLLYGGDVELPEPFAGWQRVRLPEYGDFYAYLSPR